MMTVGRANAIETGSDQRRQQAQSQFRGGVLGAVSTPTHKAQAVLDGVRQLNAALANASRLGWIVSISLESSDATDTPCRVRAQISKEI